MRHTGSSLRHADFLVAACMWDLVPQPGIEPGPPLHWERGVLPTGPPGKSSSCFQPTDYSVCLLRHLLELALPCIWGVCPCCQTAHSLFISSATFGVVVFTEKMLSKYHFLFKNYVLKPMILFGGITKPSRASLKGLNFSPCIFLLQLSS